MTSTTSRRRLARRSVDATRMLMLDSAMGLLIESISDASDDDVAYAVSHIRIPDVVAEASRRSAIEQGGDADDFRPLTNGALYQIWPSQADFQADLLLHLTRQWSSVHPSPETLAGYVAQGLRGDELLHQVLRNAWEFTRSDPVFRAVLAAYPRISNDRVRAALAQSETDFLDAIAPTWQITLAVAGRRLKAGRTIAELSCAVAALIEGFTLRWLARPSSIDPDDSDGSDDLALETILLVVDSFTEPDAP